MAQVSIEEHQRYSKLLDCNEEEHKKQIMSKMKRRYEIVEDSEEQAQDENHIIESIALAEQKLQAKKHLNYISSKLNTEGCNSVVLGDIDQIRKIFERESNLTKPENSTKNFQFDKKAVAHQMQQIQKELKELEQLLKE